MTELTGWEIGLLLAAAYVALVSLVRLMRQRRDQILAELQQQIDLEQRRRKEERRQLEQRKRELESAMPPRARKAA